MLPRILAAVALCLGVVVIYQALAPVAPLDDPPPRPAASHPLAPLPAYVPPAAERLAVINARPLFDPLRRAVAEPQESGSAGGPPPDLALVGVAIGPWSSVALLKKSGAAAAITARLGDTVDGWQLVKIEPDQVIFHAGGTDYPVRMRTAAGTAPPLTPPPTPQQPTPTLTPPQPVQQVPAPPQRTSVPPPPAMTGYRAPHGGEFVDSNGRPVVRPRPRMVGPDGKVIAPPANRRIVGPSGQ